MAIFQNQKYNSLPEQVQENKDNIEYLQENAMFQWNPLGEWSALKFYKKNDLVTDGDYGTFLCIKDTEMAGAEPKDNPNFWVKVIQAGKQGRPGEMGPHGNSIESVQTVSHSNTGDETVTRAQINFSSGNSNEISIYAKNGAKGDTGATGPKGLTGTGISHITMGTPYISDNQTITPLTVEYTDGASQELSAYAQNGSGGDNNLYRHVLRIQHQEGIFYAMFISNIAESFNNELFLSYLSNNGFNSLFLFPVNGVLKQGAPNYKIAIGLYADNNNFVAIISDFETPEESDILRDVLIEDIVAPL